MNNFRFIHPGSHIKGKIIDCQSQELTTISSTELTFKNNFQPWKTLLLDAMQPRGVKLSYPKVSPFGVTSTDLNQNTELWALEPKYCVNPKDLILNFNKFEAGKNNYTLNVKPQQKNLLTISSEITSLKNNDAQMDLENFQDITDWCHPTIEEMATPPLNDEIYAPVSELNEFYYIPTTSNDSKLNLDLKEELQTTDAFENLKTQESPQNILHPNEQQTFNNNLHNSGGTMIENVKKSNIDYDNVTSNCKTWNIHSSDTSEVIKNAEIVFSEGPIDSYISRNSLEVEVIDTKNNMEVDKMVDKKDLKLDFSNILPTTQATSIDTPEVIRTALSLGTEFNLVNFINNAEIEPENSIEDSCSTLNDDTTSQYTSASSIIRHSSLSDNSSDEDFEPSKKRRKTVHRKSKNVKHNLTFEDEYSKPAKRGRPMKQNISISLPKNVSRYREMRDKNNEASRKSRLNRKMKDKFLEDEANELEDRNRRLKAKVEHLDKLVSSMRDNLMQVLLKK